uniref:Small ribosomal subunit protein bS20c n=1 Tax=Rhizochromulina marina TaxID=1034831 RepID=A0A514CQ02_9STRA|nr:ribosomal protein S20 [Rhizochromulina marina]QDH81876.1 ribosomal protein S20 [Rhizochromulina marina]
MANIKSAIKRIKIANRNNLQNKIYLSKIKTSTKNYFSVLSDLENSPTEENRLKAIKSLSLLFSRIDKAVKRQVLHKNTAARKKARLSTKLNQAN